MSSTKEFIYYGDHNIQQFFRHLESVARSAGVWAYCHDLGFQYLRQPLVEDFLVLQEAVDQTQHTPYHIKIAGFSGQPLSSLFEDLTEHKEAVHLSAMLRCSNYQLNASEAEFVSINPDMYRLKKCELDTIRWDNINWTMTRLIFERHLEHWNKAQTAINLIRGSLHKYLLTLIEGIITPLEMLLVLAGRQSHSFASPITRAYLLQDLSSLKLQKGQDVAHYLADKIHMGTMIQQHGGSMAFSTLITSILNGLPDDYECLKVLWRCSREENIGYLVEHAIQTQYALRNSGIPSPSTWCVRCKDYKHYTDNCELLFPFLANLAVEETPLTICAPGYEQAQNEAVQATNASGWTSTGPSTAIGMVANGPTDTINPSFNNTWNSGSTSDHPLPTQGSVSNKPSKTKTSVLDKTPNTNDKVKKLKRKQDEAVARDTKGSTNPALASRRRRKLLDDMGSTSDATEPQMSYMGE